MQLPQKKMVENIFGEYSARWPFFFRRQQTFVRTFVRKMSSEKFWEVRTLEGRWEHQTSPGGSDPSSILFCGQAGQQHSRRGLCWKFAFHSQVVSFLLFAEPQRYGLFSPQAGTIWVMPPILNIHCFLKKNYLPHPQRMPNCPVTSHLKFYTLVLIHIFVLLSKLVYSLQSCMLP